MIRITPVSLIIIGYNFASGRKVTHWFRPPFYKAITESVDPFDTDACAEILIGAEHLTDALEDFVMPHSKCLVEINGKVLTIKMFWQEGDVKSCARVISREQQKD